MTTFNFVCAFIVAVCFSVVSSSENRAKDYQGENKIEKPAGRAYSLSTCDYKSQVGYSCLSCHRALHCYPGNIAVLVDCYGRFRFCRDGRCSLYQGDKCGSDDNKLTTIDPRTDVTKPTISDITAKYVDQTLTAESTTRIVSLLKKEMTKSDVILPADQTETTKNNLKETTESDNVSSP